MSAYDLTREQNVDLLVKTSLEYGITDRRQIAYIVATAQHETDNFNTSREYDGPRQAIRNGYGGGENYYGRGYVQVTHDRNYDQMATTLGDPRIRNNPDIVAQEANLGAQTTVVGMSRGLYTGVGLDRYINSQNADYTGARATVNGTDRDAHIAGLARTWEQNLPDIIDRVTAQGITPRAMPGSPMADGSLSVNEKGPEVARMQEALRQRGFEVTPDGLYGNGTRGIVEQYQRQSGLPATGTADSATLNSLGVTQIVPLPNSTTPPTPNPNPNPTTPTTPTPTPPSNATPANPMADGVLRRGEEGTAVTKLQEDLTKAGFSTQGTDGKFGQNTEDAVKRYQTSRGLEADGVAGPATLRAISESQPSQQPPTTGTPTPTQPAPSPANPAVDRSWPTPGNFTVNTANQPGEGEGEFGTSRGGGARTHKGIDINGAVGDPIESMRPGKVTFAGNGGAGAGNMIIIDHGGGLETRYLHLQNINVREGQQVTEDTKIGTMGRTGNTPAAGDTHLHFETRENGVAVDPRKYLNFPARDVLQQGDEGKDVTRLQEALVRNGATIKPDGDFGPGTKAAVEAFQRSNNLTPDGIAGPATQRALGVTQEQTPTAQPTTPAPAPNTPNTPSTPPQSGALSDGVLRQGEQGEDVRKLQEALNKNGATLNADGNFGPATKAAVEGYQRSNNLDADGVAGPKTLTALGMQQQAPTPQPAPTVAGNDHGHSHDHSHDHAPTQPTQPAQPTAPTQPTQPSATDNPQAQPTQPTQPTQPSAADKPQTPPAANDQVQPPTQGDKPLMSNPNHPDNKLYQQAVSNLEQLGPGGGFKSREDLEKAAAAVAADAKATGLQSIDHISKTAAPNGQSYLVAVQGDPTSPAAKNSYIDYNQATNQTVAQSTGMAEAQKPAVQQAQTPAAQQTDPQPEPTRLAAGAR